jgi:serine/threonine-protein kinase
MGEVYRARDAKLQRDVALKVLPAAVATDAARVERFGREAKVLASLNHRNIAAIYGIDDDGDIPALVLELVDGPTLADRLTLGPIPVPDALAIARQIAEALEAAHAQGIIHRDLKPANVKVRPDGVVKVLDFGLAKAMDDNASADALGGQMSTVTSGPVTSTGVVLGTGPYMSPEQARGESVDRRTDMWAFGVVLWEMLTGRRLFKGPTLSDSIASVLTAEPDWTALPMQTPPLVRRLLQRCLEKDRSRRLDSAVAARLDLEEALSRPKEPAATGASAATRRSRRVPWLISLGLALIVVALATRDLTREPPAGERLSRVRAQLGADVLLRKDLSASVILSPDGQTLVYATAGANTASPLYVRRIDQFHATPLRGTENATSPFFSPDGQWIGFFVGRALNKVAVGGGTAVTLAEAPGGRGGAWAADDTIVFAAINSTPPVLRRVPATGGPPSPLTELHGGEISHRWPQVLPGNRGVLYTSNTSDDWDDARLVVQPLPTGAAKIVQPGFYGRYVASGHLLYMKGGTLYAAPFDLDRLEVSGPSVAVSDNVVGDTSTGGAQYDVSSTGTLVFLEGRGYSAAAPMVWMERGGNTTPLRSEPADWSNPQVSPEGKQIAIDVSDGKQTDIWVQYLDAPKLSRLTFDRADDYKPVWSPDGTGVVFTSARDGAPNLYWQRLDGTGQVQRLTESENAQTAGSWHPSGRFVAFQEARRDTGFDIMILALERRADTWTASGAARLFAGDSVNETEPRFSPDGRWLAYTSNETGRAEIFVRAFDEGGKWQISSGGGRDASWSPVRSELVYFNTADNRLMVTPYTVAGKSFHAGSSRPWAVTAAGRPARAGRTFDLHPDGERVAIVPPESRGEEHMNLVFGFFEHLRAIAPVK